MDLFSSEPVMPPKCKITPAIHFTEESQAYHLRKCVRDKIQKMGCPKSCSDYFTGLCHANKSVLGSCSVQDIDNACRSVKSTFTIDDAEKLCKLEHSASMKFWQAKYN